MNICLDFDGVIHDHRNITKGYRMGKPLPQARESIIRLLTNGNTLVIHTHRIQKEADKKHITDWLDYFEIPQLPLSLTKPKADLYVDDNGIHFTSWDSLMERLQ